MNWDAIGAVGEVVGAIAVLATLAYISMQVRLHARQLEAANDQEAYRQLSEFVTRMSTDPNAKALFEKVSLDEPLTAHDEVDWAWILAELANKAEAHFLQNRKGAMSDEVWHKFEKALTAYLTTPIGRRWWFNRMSPFSAEFVDHFDRLLDQCNDDLNYVSSIHQNKQA